MCGCKAEKPAGREIQVQSKQYEKEASARHEREKSAKQVQLDAPDAHARDEADALLQHRQPPALDPLSFETLQEALVALLQLDVKQVQLFRRWWQALGLDNKLPKEPLELSMDGHGAALDLAVAVDPDTALSVIPALFSLLPDDVPAPPDARVFPSGRPASESPPVQQVGSSPSSDDAHLQMQAAVRPARQLQSEALMMSSAPLNAWEKDASKSNGQATSDKLTPTVFGRRDECPLPPMIVGGGALPRCKAKAKSRVQRTEPHSGANVHLSAGAAPVGNFVQSMPQQSKLEPVSPGRHEPIGSIVDAPLTPKMELHEGVAVKTTIQNPESRKEQVPLVDNGPGVDAEASGRRWQEALKRSILEFSSTCVVLWLHLGGLCSPKGVARPADMGLRIQVAPGMHDTFRTVQSHHSLRDTLQEIGVAEDAWKVTEVGCSLFAHGPTVLFSMEEAGHHLRTRCDKLVEKVSLASLKPMVQSLARGSSVRTGVRAGMANERVSLAARFELVEDLRKEQPATELQSLAVDLALGKEKLFNAFLVERVKQMFHSLGGDAVVSEIQCRAHDAALVTFRISSVGEISTMARSGSKPS